MLELNRIAALYRNVVGRHLKPALGGIRADQLTLAHV